MVQEHEEGAGRGRGMSTFRDIMHRNSKTTDVDKMQECWCCGDKPWLFRKRWKKLFEDLCDVKQEKFHPSRVSELYDTIKRITRRSTTAPSSYSVSARARTSRARSAARTCCTGARRRCSTLSPPQGYRARGKVSRYYTHHTLTLFTTHYREGIGVLISLTLPHNVVGDLERARNNEECSLPLCSSTCSSTSWPAYHKWPHSPVPLRTSDHIAICRCSVLAVQLISGASRT
ncbi:hypothetical protein GY45DRAFT_595228 [Cubamyces sp. BRFM 1775]|nr:hypothetical protein GY45DRAFT_595228 [Cubamyces sp. BRFM 1775]